MLALFVCVMCSFTFKPSWDCCTEEGKKACEFYEKQKIYIHPSQVHVGTNGMFVDFGGDFCRVSEILEDENGMYVRDVGFWWRCRNGHPNPPWRVTCQVPGCNG